MATRGVIKFAFVAGGIVAILYGVNRLTPHVSKTLLQRHLEAQIPNLSMVAMAESPKIGLDYIQYESVQLDADGINTIGSLTFVVSPLKLLQGKISRIVIEDAEIVASSDPEEGLLFDGWLAEDGLAYGLGLKAERITVKNSDFTFLTDNYGGISVRIDASAQLRHGKQGSDGAEYEYQARFTSQQRQISLSGNANGRFSKARFSSDMTFDRGRLAVPRYDIQMARLSGRAEMGYHAGQFNVFSEIRAGGMRLNALPWRNASMSYHYKDKASEIFLSAQSVGVEGIELAMTIPSQSENITTKIHTPDEETWNRYIETNKIGGEDLKKLISLLSELNAEIELE